MNIFSWPFGVSDDARQKLRAIEARAESLVAENVQLAAENSDLRRQLDLANDLLDTARKRADGATTAILSALDVLRDWVASR